MGGEPIEGQVLLLTAAKASVSPTQLPPLVERTQALLAAELECYRREYECVYEGDERAVFLVDRDHWDELGGRLDLDPRELSAVQRAHEEQLLRAGRRGGREKEFEAALEIRDPVVIAAEGEPGD